MSEARPGGPGRPLGAAGPLLPAELLPLPDGVADLIPAYLPRQRWYAGDKEAPVGDLSLFRTGELTVTAGGAHRLLWALVDAGGSRYQLLIGERPGGEPAEFLNGHEAAVLGEAGGRYYYDGTLDPELTLALFNAFDAGGAARVRPISAEQSNTSLVFDDKVIFKLFRRLREGDNPDVVVTRALDAAGFEHVARPVAVWERDGMQLAFAQEYLAGGTDGWALALTSLRDLYASGTTDDPSQAGGDFAAEASRLGRMTAEMHLALASAFGIDRAGLHEQRWQELVDGLETGLRGVLGAAGTGADLLARLRAVRDPGPAIRVHGDYHLGQVMRTDSGWYVLDFEGEPARPIEERLQPTSPVKDVTGMLRSFGYASRFVLIERADAEAGALEPLAWAWEQRNRRAFVDGYLAQPGIEELLPPPGEARAGVFTAFELEKALYELAYERAYRPDWVAIPEAAIQRLLAGS